MKIISNRKGHYQPLVDRPIEVYNEGMTIPRRGFVFVPDCLTQEGRKERGEITSFTVAARRRLRRCLLSETVPDSFRCHATFTVPWKGDNFAPLMDEFRECWNRFGVLFRRAYPNSSMIYRVELQKRGAPHIHALTYLKDGDGDGLDAPRAADSVAVAALLQVDLFHMWSRSVPDLHHGSIEGFVERGVKVEPIPDSGALYRYVCDHTSKHKQAQLGYKGKQWGKVGQCNLVKAQAAALPDFIDDRHEVRFLRMLRKVMRYRVTARRMGKPWKRPPVFGSVLKGSARSIGDFYLSRDTVLKMWEFSQCQNAS